MSALLEVRDLTVRFRSKTALRALVERDRHPWIEAVCDVSFSIGEGETMALVGEYGSGKTTLARSIIGLVEPAAGSNRFSGCQIGGVSRGEMKRVRNDWDRMCQDEQT